MKILAIEFSSEQRSVAIADAGMVLGTASETATRNTRAFALIEQALAEAHLEREQIECLAIGLGPGSYTGIRSALAVAQGWQLATEIKLLGLESIECLAAAAQAEGCLGVVNLVTDAQRNELYLARYEISATGYKEIAPLKLATLEEVRAQSAHGELIVGPEANRWFPDARPIFPTAAILARLANARTNFVSGETLEPIYLRETNFVKAPPLRILPTL